MRYRVRVLARRQDAHPVESHGTAGLGKPAARLAGSGRMIHITTQMRVLVAIEPVDGRKGINSLARLCQERLAEIHSLDACLCSGAAAGRRSGCSVMTA